MVNKTKAKTKTKTKKKIVMPIVQEWVSAFDSVEFDSVLGDKIKKYFEYF